MKNTAIIALADTIRKYSRLMAQMKHNDFSQLCRLGAKYVWLPQDSWVVDRFHLAVFSHGGERERQKHRERGRVL